MKLSRMDEGDGMEKAFLNRRAKFHKTCSLKFNKNELQRAAKRQVHVDEEISSEAKEKFTRQKVRRHDDATGYCFFCDGPATDSNPLHKTSTLELDTRVRQCAINLQDQRLIAKLRVPHIIVNV